MLIDQEKFSPPRSNGFLVIDGVNGAGKSTLQARLSAHLQKRRRSVLMTREPGATPLGRRLRSLLIEADREEMSHRAELFLFAADRAEHVERVIKPALKESKIVISDRYYYSTEAFQGYGRGIDLDELRLINRLAIGGLLPDLVLLLDLDPADGLRRTQKRSQADGAEDSFEAEDIAFHQRIRQGFRAMAETAVEPFAIIDASQPEEAVFQQVLPLVEKLYL